MCVESLSDPELFVQAVVVQQDSFIEEQRQALSERSSASSCSSLSRAGSRPSSLIEQEKQRSLEKQRQELAALHRQQAAHAEERRKREKEWEQKEEQLAEREGLLHSQVPQHAAAPGPQGLIRHFSSEGGTKINDFRPPGGIKEGNGGRWVELKVVAAR